jgi:hypothetical protein
MGARADQYIEQFTAANQRLIDAVQGLSDEAWKKTTAAEGWPAGVCAHHAAASTEPVAGLVHMLATTGQLPPFSTEDLDKGNAAHAIEAANCSKDEVTQLLRTSGASAVNILKGITDDQFDRRAVLGSAGELSAADLTQGILIAHLETHRASIS